MSDDLRELVSAAIEEAAGLDRRTGRHDPVRASHSTVTRLRRRIYAVLRELPEYTTVEELKGALETKPNYPEGET